MAACRQTRRPLLILVVVIFVVVEQVEHGDDVAIEPTGGGTAGAHQVHVNDRAITKPQGFRFHRVFGPNDTNQVVYEESIREVVQVRVVNSRQPPFHTWPEPRVCAGHCSPCAVNDETSAVCPSCLSPHIVVVHCCCLAMLFAGVHGWHPRVCDCLR